MSIRIGRYSYRFAEQVLNSKPALKQEVESIILDYSIVISSLSSLSRHVFNEILEERFVAKKGNSQPAVFGDSHDSTAKLYFLKERIGIEVQFGHSSFIGINI